MSDITRDYSFGGWLRHLRTENNITLREACRRLNMDSGNYSKMERSELPPPKDGIEVERIASAIGAEKSIAFLKSLAFQDHLSKLRWRFK